MGGTLFLGGVPTQPDGAPYVVTYTGPLLQNPSAVYSIPSATEVLVNGIPVPGAAAEMQADAAGGSKWIVDSGAFFTGTVKQGYDEAQKRKGDVASFFQNKTGFYARFWASNFGSFF